MIRPRSAAAQTVQASTVKASFLRHTPSAGAYGAGTRLRPTVYGDEPLDDAAAEL